MNKAFRYLYKVSWSTLEDGDLVIMWLTFSRARIRKPFGIRTKWLYLIGRRLGMVWSCVSVCSMATCFQDAQFNMKESELLCISLCHQWNSLQNSIPRPPHVTTLTSSECGDCFTYKLGVRKCSICALAAWGKLWSWGEGKEAFQV